MPHIRLVANSPYEMLAFAVLKQAVKDIRNRDSRERLDALKFLYQGNGELSFWTSMAGTENTSTILKGIDKRCKSLS